ncbi:carbohydrate ABC transporter membrane protein 1, CUT1 family (plasmid) [Peptoclostridium acidaminophilum DSM 3953]|uniref:Carbohydrate ABC transporter membrane protein 1, CUT1 family n=2 Tax=Peptoclostridium acidaminophilum TaxID=1731 RepID=W8TAH2_PEPAC|nr:carbohydrate ABC transporter membrane protein 1, CUT1 family [Peptoclostridium acidaminophilum DSM 3953]
MFTELRKRHATPYALIAPVLIFMIIVYGYPLLLTFKYSFQDVSLIGSKSIFVGLANYKRVLTDPKFYNTLILTLKWTVLTVALKIGFGFILAMFLNGEIYLKKIYRFLVLIPWAIPQVVVSILWAWILDGQYGYLNYYLQKMGLIENAIYWLSSPRLAFISTSVVDAWIGIPLVTMIFLSGLSAIPDSFYEAARVDGANALQKFVHITLPSMKKVILIALTLTTIWTFNSFNVIFVLTGGGPMGGTETMMIRIYKETFGKYNLGMSATLSVAVFVILTALSIFYWKQINKDED